jgi:hypothetical protein
MEATAFATREDPARLRPSTALTSGTSLSSERCPRSLPINARSWKVEAALVRGSPVRVAAVSEFGVAERLSPAFWVIDPAWSLNTGQCRVLRHSNGGGRFILFSFEIEDSGHIETSLEAIPGGLRRMLAFGRS